MQANAHDALFKSAFSQVEHAAGELRHVLPAGLVARLDFGTLALCPGSFVDEALKERTSDLLFSVLLGDRRALIYVLFEHQSRVEELMIFRLLRYEVRIWEGWLKEHPSAKRLPPILPVVLHHSEKGWTAAITFDEVLDVDPESLALIAEHVPRFRFLLDDISHATDDSLKARAMTAFARLVLWCLRHAREPDQLIGRLGGWRDVVREVQLAPNGLAALRILWRYILVTGDHRPEDVVQRLVEAAGEEAKEDIVTTADQLREEGRKLGHREGHREGELQGERRALLRLLSRRFGAIPDAVAMQVKGADTAQLDQWIDRALTAPTLSDVFGDT